MAHDVFISYSSKDKLVADAVCASLEAAKIRCWITPRDILPGLDWAESIEGAITRSKLLILIFSSYSNNSKQVSREISLAFNSEVTVIPFRIEDIEPKGAMKYYLLNTHWQDALTKPIENHIKKLIEIILTFISNNNDAKENMESEEYKKLLNKSGDFNNFQSTIDKTKDTLTGQDAGNKGRELSNLGRYEEALPYFEKAVKLQGNWVDYNWLGTTLSRLGRYEEALPYLKKSLEIQDDKTNISNYSWLGTTLTNMGRHEEALTYFKKAVKIQGDGADYSWLGTALSNLGRYEEALPHFKKAVKIQGNWIDYNWLGTTLSRLGRYEEALPYLKKSLEIQDDKTNISNYNWIGNTLYNMGRYEEALPYFEKALELRGDETDKYWVNTTRSKLKRF